MKKKKGAAGSKDKLKGYKGKRVSADYPNGWIGEVNAGTDEEEQAYAD